jgi:5-methylcytosine-specific restriction endonuclease McrA
MAVMERHEFTKRTRLEAFARCNGRCEDCGTILRPGGFDYDHDKPSAFGGEAILGNCRVLCKSCHGTKTFKRDVPAIAKSNRIRARQAGIKKQSKFACSKTSRWKKKLDGRVVAR